MKLKDKRLLVCGELTEGSFVCDIGTDHGYLPAHLILTGKCTQAIAADVNALPLQSAETTFMRENISDRIKTYLSDGLESVPLENVTDIVIAGMGGELIAHILSSAKAKTGAFNFILQPMTKAEYLRRYLAENGFDVKCEKAVRDGRFVYTVIKCRYDGLTREIDDITELCGYLSPDDSETSCYISFLTSRLKKAADGMRLSDKAESDKLYAMIDRLYERYSAEHLQ